MTEKEVIKVLKARYRNIQARCTNKKHTSYPRYGAKGIRVYWKSFQEFYDDMSLSYKEHLEKHGYADTTVDRIDNSKGYSKENCRWATRVEQSVNRSRNTIITFRGKTQTLAQWAKEIGCLHGTLRSRIHQHKWPIEKALTQSIRPGGVCGPRKRTAIDEI